MTNKTTRNYTWVTRTELADMYNVHPLTISRWAESGKIPCMRMGRVLRFPLELVEETLMKTAGQTWPQMGE